MATLANPDISLIRMGSGPKLSGLARVNCTANTCTMYSQSCLFWTPWDPMKLSLLQRCPHFTGLFIHNCIALGPQLPVLIIEVSLF